MAKKKLNPLTARQAEVLKAVRECDGNLTEAARLLGRHRASIQESYNAALEKIQKGAMKTPMPKKDRPRPLPVPSEQERITQWRANRINEILAELCRRRYEALRLYEPLPHLADYHASMAHERILRSGVRAGKAQPIDEPVLTPNGFVPIGSLLVGDVVIGGDGKPCVVDGVFPQGVKETFRLTFNDGAWTRCCDEHLWLVRTRSERKNGARAGDWITMSLRSIRDRVGDEPVSGSRVEIPTCVSWMPKRTTPIDPYLLGVLLGDGHLGPGGPSVSSGDDEIVQAVSESIPSGLRLRQGKHPGKIAFDYRICRSPKKAGLNNEIVDACRYLGIWGCRSWEKFVPKDYLFNTHDVRFAVLQGLMDTDGTIGERRSRRHKFSGASFTTTSRQLANDVAFLVRSLGGRCSHGRWVRKKFSYKGEMREGRPSLRMTVRFNERCPFRLTRKALIWHNWRVQAVRSLPRLLAKIEPAGPAECVCISVTSPTHTYVTRDCIVTHNTLCAAVEFARAATEQDPYGKFQVGKGGTGVIVGFDQDHIGKVIYPVLFERGAFEIIRDGVTNRWRPFLPEDPRDIFRAHLAVPAPPLIPQRFIKNWSWERKHEHVFAVCRLYNGWEIWAYSSRAKPPQGFRADAYWFDEDLDDPAWIEEALARIADGKGGGGRLTWSARPHSRTIALLRMSQRAALQKRERPDDPDIVEWQFNRKLNTHVDKLANERLSRALRFQGEDVQKMMDLGEYTIDEWKMFPELSRGLHEVPLSAPELAKGHLPLSWTRFAVIDPGVQVCAVLFAAVPPPEFGDFIYLEDELYIRNCTDQKLAEGMKLKIAGKRYYAWIIDEQGSHSRWVTGKRISEQYRDAFEEHDIRAERTGYGFLRSFTKRMPRVEMMHRCLAPREDSPPKLRIVEGRLPNWWAEAETYHRKRERDPLDPSRWIMTDEPDDRGPVHLQVATQYLVMCKAVYYHPHIRMEGGRSSTSPVGVSKYLREKQERLRNRNRHDGPGYVNLGPGR